MPVVDVREMFRGQSRSAQYGNVPVYTRVFLVTTDEFTAPNGDLTIQDISASPGIGWLDPHPENDKALLIESNIQQEGDSPFHWKMTFTYKTGTEWTDSPLYPDRPAQFSFSGSLASAPAFWHYPSDNDNSTKAIIVNSAGDPIGGLDRDEGEFTVTVTANFAPPFPYVKAQQYVGAINGDSFWGGDPKTWKCVSITGNRKIETKGDMEPIIYWEVNSTLAYRGTGWDLRTWDVGFNEVVAGRRVKIMAGSEPVSENGLAPPQALSMASWRA
jgi:hypothetical protein